MTYGDDELDRDDRRDRGSGSVGALPAGDCWPTEGSWPAGPSYWLPRPRASRELGGSRRADAGRTVGSDRRPAAEPGSADDFLLPGDYWPAGEDYWSGPALGGRGPGITGLVAGRAADHAAGMAVDRDEPFYGYPVYDYEDGQP